MADCWNEGFELGLRAAQEAAEFGGLHLADKAAFAALLRGIPRASDTPRRFAAWKAANLQALQAAAGPAAWEIVVGKDADYMSDNA